MNIILGGGSYWKRVEDTVRDEMFEEMWELVTMPTSLSTPGGGVGGLTLFSFFHIKLLVRTFLGCLFGLCGGCGSPPPVFPQGEGALGGGSTYSIAPLTKTWPPFSSTPTPPFSFLHQAHRQVSQLCNGGGRGVKLPHMHANVCNKYNAFRAVQRPDADDRLDRIGPVWTPSSSWDIRGEVGGIEGIWGRRRGYMNSCTRQRRCLCTGIHAWPSNNTYILSTYLLHTCLHLPSLMQIQNQYFFLGEDQNPFILFFGKINYFGPFLNFSWS